MKSWGFTVAEVLIVITIIIMLASAFLVGFNPKTQIDKARDSKRKADLELMRAKLEDYYNDKGRYPAALACGDDFSPYLTTVPCDPRGGDYLFQTTSGQEYQLYTKLDYSKDPAIVSVGCESGCGPGLLYNYGVSSPNVGL